jgi:hypothetical protein
VVKCKSSGFQQSGGFIFYVFCGESLVAVFYKEVLTNPTNGITVHTQEIFAQ